MNETVTTLVGNVCGEVRLRSTGSGEPVASFRVASTTRRFDRSRGAWADGDTLYVTILCFRRLAENVASSFAKGEPVIVRGRLKQRHWEADGRSGTALELEAYEAGHDLNRGTAAFVRNPQRSTEAADRSVADELAVEVAQQPLEPGGDAEVAA